MNHSPYRWWMTLGNKRYNSVPPRATARQALRHALWHAQTVPCCSAARGQVVYKGQVWSFTDRDKKQLNYFKFSTMGSVRVAFAPRSPNPT